MSGKKIVRLDPQDFGDHKKLQIRHAPDLILQLRDRLSAGIPPVKLEFRREDLLGPPFACAQLLHLRANHVERYVVDVDAGDPSRRRLTTAEQAAPAT